MMVRRILINYTKAMLLLRWVRWLLTTVLRHNHLVHETKQLMSITITNTGLRRGPIQVRIEFD